MNLFNDYLMIERMHNLICSLIIMLIIFNCQLSDFRAFIFKKKLKETVDFARACMNMFKKIIQILILIFILIDLLSVTAYMNYLIFIILSFFAFTVLNKDFIFMSISSIFYKSLVNFCECEFTEWRWSKRHKKLFKKFSEKFI